MIDGMIDGMAVSFRTGGTSMGGKTAVKEEHGGVKEKSVHLLAQTYTQPLN